MQLFAINATRRCQFSGFQNAAVLPSLFADGYVLTCSKSNFVHKLEGLMSEGLILRIQQNWFMFTSNII